jgi:hypothetical protein
MLAKDYTLKKFRIADSYTEVIRDFKITTINIIEENRGRKGKLQQIL